MRSISDAPEGERKPNTAASAPSAAGRILSLLAVSLLLCALGLLCAAYLICRGPSPRAAARFAEEARGRRALAPLAALLLPQTETEAEPLPAEPAGAETPAEADDTFVVAEDEPSGADDGVVVEPVYGRGFTGYMMIVSDPSRVIVGCVPSSMGGRGFTVAEFAERFDAVAAINAGGFVDDGGMGDGSTPDSLVVFEGAFYSAGRGTGQGFVGLDSEHRLHVGIKTVQEIRDADIQYGVCFGPVLIRDGAITDESRMQSEVNPRSAIGQREDGTILLLVVDGRQVASLGATILDMARVMADYGAVNACNLDGGTSSLMWYDGAYLNRGPLLAKPRPVPDAIIVLPEGG